MRLDKLLSSRNLGSRSELKECIKKGLVTVNGKVAKQPEMKVKEEDQIFFKGNPCVYEKYAYYLLNKPAGVITATKDRHTDTVLTLLGSVPARNLFPVGRLDKDAEGLLLITNDGELGHAMLSPKKKVAKTYFVRLRTPFSANEIQALEEGVDIGDDQPTLPARVKMQGDDCLLLTICEGRYHQVKRMMQAVGNEVIHLKRISFGNLTLPEDLGSGAYRELTMTEREGLKCYKK